MAVDVDGDLDRRVPHLFLHVGQRFTVLNQQRSERVPDVVDADLPQVGAFQQTVEDAVTEVVAFRLAAFAVRWCSRNTSVSLSDMSTRRRFEFFVDVTLPATRVASYLDEPTCEVDVTPMEREQFAKAHPDPEHAEEELVELAHPLLDGLQQLVDFNRGERLNKGGLFISESQVLSHAKRRAHLTHRP